MKKLALVAALAIPLLVVAGFVVKDRAGNKKSTITFYETPLVCNAAPEIGCGSRAKPALLALETNPAVKEAWLNRAGTIVAIVWTDKAETETVARPIFEKNNIEFSVLGEKDAKEQSKSFPKVNAWYRGADVDILSKEEASTIAETAVKFALQNKIVNKEEGEKIKADLEAYFKKELVMIRTNDQLNDDSENKWMKAMYEIVEKHIGSERTEQAMKLYRESCEKQCKKDGSCTQPGSKKSCCNKD
jgi:hypothetical protein